ncbi:enolase C-terminal domain-like protein [Amnibacterium sp.]|uniref:enolase C-terminal domain-like protein n=1 Tax=Amnibacterium sp. TaxID=1872496 RepID=UPI003F7CCC52
MTRDVPQVETLEARAYTIPTDSPEADGTIAWDATTIILVTATAAGATGVGWTYGPAACAAIVEGLLRPVVVGADADRPPALNERMIRAVRNATRAGIAGYAISAVDVALWDLAARLDDMPLHRRLGSIWDDVPVYGSGGFTTYDAARLEQQLTTWTQEQRIPRVKIKIGESWGSDERRDLARIEQARAIIGDDIVLFVDANGGYSAKQAVRVMREAGDAGVTWFEEPVSSDDLGGLSEVRAAVLADVAAGEYGTDEVYFRRMCESGAVDCLQADATRCGGYTVWLRAAAVAHSFGLQLSGHCAPNLHAHVAGAAPNLRHLEWFHDHVRIESLCFDGVLDPFGGAVTPRNDVPGHGLTIKQTDIERYRAA